MKHIDDTWHPAGGIAISEFGFVEPFEHSKTNLADILIDPIRTGYIHDYMEAILMAISEGVNILGCLAWAFIDNLEWNSGYYSRFGLQYVNYTTQERYYKASFFEYRDTFYKYLEE